MKSFTPKIGISIIVLFLVIYGGVMIYNRNQHTLTSSSVPDSQYANGNSTLAANAENEGDIGQYYDGTKSAKASSSGKLLPKPADISQYIFPGSTVKISNSKKLELESDQTVEKITDWYKNKINELNFNAKSFSQTTTNGAVFNKLTAVKPGEKIDITIKKDQSTSNIVITVDRS